MQMIRAGVFVALLVSLSGAVHAQGLSAQELDRLSQEKLDAGAYRNLGGRPAPQSSIPRDVLHQPDGIWVCMGTGDYQPVLGGASASSAKIGIAYGQVAAGSAEGQFTRILLREGKIGYVPSSSLKPYHNKFNSRATCSVGGLRADGSLVFNVQ